MHFTLLPLLYFFPLLRVSTPLFVIIKRSEWSLLLATLFVLYLAIIHLAISYFVAIFAGLSILLYCIIPWIIAFSVIAAFHLVSVTHIVIFLFSWCFN